MLSAFFSPGRRRGFRRAGEERNAYVDRPSGRVAAWAIAIVLLSALDAMLTLAHVRSGGAEAMPTMRFALGFGEVAFAMSKMLITGAGVVFLVLHENFAFARIGFRLLLSCYVVLIVYHFALAAVR